MKIHFLKEWAGKYQSRPPAGIFNFTAPYLPWVLLAFSMMLGSSPVVDLMGIAAGE